MQSFLNTVNNNICNIVNHDIKHLYFDRQLHNSIKVLYQHHKPTDDTEHTVKMRAV